jgi:hypothetical protein
LCNNRYRKTTTIRAFGEHLSEHGFLLHAVHVPRAETETECDGDEREEAEHGGGVFDVGRRRIHAVHVELTHSRHGVIIALF